MFFIKAVLIVLWFAVIPVCMGSLLYGGKKNAGAALSACLIYGYAMMFALFELLALPAIFGKAPFALLKYLYSGVCLFLSGMAVFRYGKTLAARAAGEKKLVFLVREAGKKADMLRRMHWSMWAAFLLIAVQMGAYVFGMATDLDDSFYVATATTTLETGGMFTYGAYTGRLAAALPARYVLAPFPILLAFYSDMVQMHPAAVAHTVQPVFFLLLSYSVYAQIGRKLCKGDAGRTGFFLFFTALVQMFSYYSVYTQGTFLMVRIWQGKAMLASFVLPAVFYSGRCCMEETADGRDWFGLLCLMISACLVSSMGVMLAPIMLMLLALLYGTKGWRVKGWRWKKMALALACCIPDLLCAAAYLCVK